MQIGNASQTALQGLQNSMRELDRNASTLARPAEENGNSAVDKTEALVKVKSSSNTAQANARVLKTADEMMGKLIDIQA